MSFFFPLLLFLSLQYYGYGFPYGQYQGMQGMQGMPYGGGGGGYRAPYFPGGGAGGFPVAGGAPAFDENQAAHVPEAQVRHTCDARASSCRRMGTT